MDAINRQVGNLAQLLNAAAMRQRVVAQNIANANTPLYRRQDVAFEEQLAADIRDGKPDTTVVPTVYEVEGLAERADGNTVDIDHEIGELNRNAMMYQTWLQIVSSRLGQMHHAIRG